MSDLEQLIKLHVQLGKPSAQGYHGVKCAVCHDYKDRGGFKFEGGGVHYNCFNCSTSAGWEPGRRINKKLLEVLTSFGVPEAEIRAATFQAALDHKDDEPKPQAEPELKFPNEVALPPMTSKLSQSTSALAPAAKLYLSVVRGLNPDEFEYMISEEKKYEARLIIPCYFREKVIYWQARDMAEVSKAKYLNPLIPRDNIMFNMDELYRYTDEPLFVTEGPLDALSLGRNAVALLGSTLSKFKLRELLKVTRRQVVFIIDKNLNGFKLGNHALEVGAERGWKVVCLPDSVDDANNALQQGLGRLWLISYVVEHACNGFQGRLHLKMHCKDNEPRKTKAPA